MLSSPMALLTAERGLEPATSRSLAWCSADYSMACSQCDENIGEILPGKGAYLTECTEYLLHPFLTFISDKITIFTTKAKKDVFYTAEEKLSLG